eukprot:5943930-Pyramimonas_sp.AAC.1
MAPRSCGRTAPAVSVRADVRGGGVRAADRRDAAPGGCRARSSASARGAAPGSCSAPRCPRRASRCGLQARGCLDARRLTSVPVAS